MSGKKIAVLGSRDISKETFKQIRAFACSIALKGGHTIVTGGARGADHAALLGALDAGTTPIAIIPTVIDHQPVGVRKDLQRCEVIDHPW
ncbi:MAG: DNA-processing protein DprA, partial [Candidatus Omnitrophica bacterium]|nr:DNA-processing protein DprA [Candidatus Omnitrophota bacterium]